MSARRVLLVAALVAVGFAAALTVASVREPDGPANRATEPTEPATNSPVDFDRPPYTEGIEVGHIYNYSLNAHCGIHSAPIDGTNWRATPPLDDGNGNPPEGWRGIIGKLQVVSHDKAVFTTDEGSTATFVRADLPGRGACA